MNRTGYYWLIGAIAVLGLCLGLILFPFYHQLSLMFLYDKQYQKALPRYQELYEEGQHSPEVVAPLIQLELEQAEDDKAMQILIDYAEKHPTEPEAQELKGNLLKELNYDHAYARHLQETETPIPSVKRLREERELYNSFGEQDNVRTVLEKIIVLPDAKAAEFRDLAYLHAAAGNSARALEVVRLMLTRIPKQTLTAEEAQFAMVYLADTDHGEEAAALAQALIPFQQTQKQKLAIIQTLLDIKLGKEGLALLDQFPEDARLSPDVISARLSLLWSLPDGQATIWKYLRQLHAEGYLPDAQKLELLELAVGYGDIALVNELVNSAPLEQMEEPLALRVLRMALAHEDTNLATALQARLGEAYLREYPLVQMALQVAVAQEPTAADAAKIETWTERQRAVMAMVYAAKHDPKTAKAILEKVESWKGIDAEFLVDLSLLYIEANMVDKGRALAAEQPAGTSGDHQLIVLLFDTADGKSDIVLQTLQELGTTVPEGSLVLLANVAKQRKQAPLALALTQQLSERFPTPANQLRLGEALVMNNRMQEGISLLITLYKAGNEDAADPLLIALARASREEALFQPAFESLLTKLLQDPKRPRIKWREIGFQFIDLKAKSEATRIFLLLADGRGFNDPDVQTLLQLWGEKPGQQAIDWMIARARVAKGKERIDWLKTLAGVRASRAIVDLVTESEWENAEIADIYLSALLELKDRERLETFITRVYAKEDKPKRLKILAKAAKDYDLKDLAQDVYQKVLEITPDDLTVVKALGEIALAKGSVDWAKWYFDWYLSEGPGDYQVNLMMGDLLWQDQDRPRAFAFYEDALDDIDALPKRNLAAERAEAHIQYRFGCVCEAISHYYTLIEKHPKELSLRIELAQLLIDIEAFGAAASWLYDDVPEAKADELPFVVAQQDAELAMTRQRLFREMHRFATALEISNAALQAAPENGALWAARGELENDIGRWQRALGYLTGSQRLEPDNVLYAKAYESLWDDHRSFFDVQTENRLTSPAQHERFTRAFLDWQFYPGLRAFARCERDWMTLDAYTVFNNGEIVPFDGVRYRGYVSLEREWDTGNSLMGTLFGGDGVIGAGGVAQALDFWGRWRLFGEYHEPCWDITESTIEHGARNRIGIERRQYLAKRVELLASYAYQRFYLFANRWAGTSWELQGLLSYQLWPEGDLLKHFPSGTIISYNFLWDIETITKTLTKVNDQGLAYQPLDLNSRESTITFLGVRLPLHPALVLEGTAGYYFDFLPRKGGAVGHVALTAGRKGQPQVQIDYSHYISTQNNTSVVNSFIFNVKVPF